MFISPLASSITSTSTSSHFLERNPKININSKAVIAGLLNEISKCNFPFFFCRPKQTMGCPFAILNYFSSFTNCVSKIKFTLNAG